jgi:hypothetical protein
VSNELIGEKVGQFVGGIPFKVDVLGNLHMPIAKVPPVLPWGLVCTDSCVDAADRDAQ